MLSSIDKAMNSLGKKFVSRAKNQNTALNVLYGRCIAIKHVNIRNSNFIYNLRSKVGVHLGEWNVAKSSGLGFTSCTITVSARLHLLLRDDSILSFFFDGWSQNRWNTISVAVRLQDSGSKNQASSFSINVP